MKYFFLILMIVCTYNVALASSKLDELIFDDNLTLQYFSSFQDNIRLKITICAANGSGAKIEYSENVSPTSIPNTLSELYHLFPSLQNDVKELLPDDHYLMIEESLSAPQNEKGRVKSFIGAYAHEIKELSVFSVKPERLTLKPITKDESCNSFAKTPNSSDVAKRFVVENKFLDLEIEGFAQNKRTKIELSNSTIAAAYISKKLEKIDGKVYKTKVHKLVYFLNGLHYILFGEPIIIEPFEAHQFGVYSQKTQELLISNLDNSLKCSPESSELLSYKESINIEILSDVIILIFGKYSAQKLSDLTHEPSTPWSQTRPQWYMAKKTEKLNMMISVCMDKQYFTNLINIKRFFLEPYLKGKVEKTKNTSLILGELVNKQPNLFSSFINFKLDSIKENIENSTSEEIKYFIDSTKNVLLSKYKGINDYHEVLRQSLGNIFVNRQQNIIEGALSEVLFEWDFIEKDEGEYFFDESFRMRTAYAAKFNNLTALYYLERIFETFSEVENDDANQYAKYTSQRRHTIINAILSSQKTVGNENWQILYEIALSCFYDISNSEMFIVYLDKLIDLPIPERYKKDLLRRGIVLSGDKKYINKGIELSFDEFFLYKATDADSIDEAFPFFEQAIRAENPLAYFEAGKCILREAYTVLSNSVLWKKFDITPPIDEDQNNTQNILLGEKLIIQAIQLNVQEALSFFIDWCGDDFDKALRDIPKINQPWYYYKVAQIKERQYNLNEAIATYTKSGPLLGYIDAARLDSKENENILLKQYQTEKNKILKELYEILD